MKTKRTATSNQNLIFCLAVLFISLHSPLQINAQCENTSDRQEQLKIISWNIYMLPHLLIHTGQITRANYIGDALKNEDADIIVFEEAFDNKARQVIWNKLKNSFPYQSVNPPKNVFWKISGGVWIVSKVPIREIKRIYFKESKGSDRMACKGAFMIEAEKNNLCFQLVGTHLQSDLDHKDVREVRRSQYKQIEELLDECRKKNVPQFVVGDFNTIRDDSSSYQQMIGIMKVSECCVEGDLCYSYDYSSNDFILNQPCKPQLIDYVLYRDGDERKIKGQSCVKVYREKWDDKHEDLSDHFAVAAIISMK